MRNHQPEKLSPPNLIISADWRNINDGIRVVKERRPCVSLPTGTANIVEPPLHRAVVVLNDESVFRDTNGLNPRVEDIVDAGHVSPFGDPVDLIKETVGRGPWSAGQQISLAS